MFERRIVTSMNIIIIIPDLQPVASELHRRNAGHLVHLLLRWCI